MEQNNVLRLVEALQKQNNQFFLAMAQLAIVLDDAELNDAQKLCLVEDIYKKCLINILKAEMTEEELEIECQK